MKLLLTASFLVSAATAFSAVAPQQGANIDRSMKKVDESSTFDPTAGENSALKRNNKDGVWVEQVCRTYWYDQ